MHLIYSQDECPCGNLPTTITKTDHEDEAIVVDVVTGVGLRCRLCGRSFKGQLVPGDATLGSELASRGNDGRPRLSLSAARHARVTPFERLKRLAGGSGYSITRAQADEIGALLATRITTAPEEWQPRADV